MTEYTRYAVYYAPPVGSALAAFGASWLGWDASSGEPVAHPVETLGGLAVDEITRTPRKYGFHGTLKPPFRLADGTDFAGLRAAFGDLACTIQPFDGPPFRLARLGAFLALVPAEPCAPLRDMAAACVQSIDAFRAPPTETELKKRRANRLSEPQEANLTRWGYPYVLDEFRFHLTLSGRLDPEDADNVETALRPLTAPLLGAPAPFREICLFGETVESRFRIIERIALGG